MARCWSMILTYSIILASLQPYSLAHAEEFDFIKEGELQGLGQDMVLYIFANYCFENGLAYTKEEIGLIEQFVKIRSAKRKISQIEKDKIWTEQQSYISSIASRITEKECTSDRAAVARQVPGVGADKTSPSPF